MGCVKTKSAAAPQDVKPVVIVNHATANGALKVPQGESWPDGDHPDLRGSSSFVSVWESEVSTSPANLAAFHTLVEQGDLDGLTALLAEHGESLAPGERESMEQERERLAIRAKRAAAESLSVAMTNQASAGSRTEHIRRSIQIARKRGVDDADIWEAEEALEKEEMMARADPWANTDGQPAFEAIEEDDVEKLQSILVGGRPWAYWRDKYGRDLRACAEETAEGLRQRGGDGATAVLECFNNDGGMTPEKWKEAFKLTSRDDAPALAELLAGCSPLVWSAYKNAGGRTLLELAEERSRENVMMYLSLAAGKVKDLPQHKMPNVGDSVWVYEEHSIQPTPGRVADPVDCKPGFVTVQFWDREETRNVNHLHLRKMLLA
jgi:hypothetical protein